MLTTATVAQSLASDWGMDGFEVAVHTSGMNSQTWLVKRGDERWIAKAVMSASLPGFASGLTLARHVDAARIPAGDPVPTRDGAQVVEIGA